MKDSFRKIGAFAAPIDTRIGEAFVVTLSRNDSLNRVVTPTRYGGRETRVGRAEAASIGHRSYFSSREWAMSLPRYPNKGRLAFPARSKSPINRKAKYKRDKSKGWQ